MNSNYKKKAESLAGAYDCEIEETDSNIWLNAPEGKLFVCSGATTSLLFDLDTRDRSGRSVRPDWKSIYSTIKTDIGFGFEDSE